MGKYAKVLIVDDNMQNIQVLGSILRENGYSVAFAVDGKQALGILERVKDFDLVLLDVDMPVMDGFDTCRAIQKNDLFREIPVIFLTAFTETDNIIEGFNIGAKDYVTKPFNDTELLARIRTHVDLKRSRDKLKTVNAWLEQKVAERTFELKQANGKLEQARKELEVLDRTKTEFLQLLSHEIRTPLNGIVGSVDLLKHFNLSEEGIELFEILDQSVNRLERFSYKALDIMELRSEKAYNKENANIRLPLFFETYFQQYEKELLLKNIKIEKEFELLNITIQAKEYYLDKCFSNLLENAIFYSPAGGTIKVKVLGKNEGVTCFIEDEGPGFPKEIIKSPLTPFLFHERNDNKPGLGLYYVYLVMRLHNGKFSYGNNKNKGAYVKLEFPGMPVAE